MKAALALNTPTIITISHIGYTSPGYVQSETSNPRIPNRTPKTMADPARIATASTYISQAPSSTYRCGSQTN